MNKQKREKMEQINYPTDLDLAEEHRRYEEKEEAMAKEEAEASGYNIKMEEWKKNAQHRKI